jgi:hypothetical protein
MPYAGTPVYTELGFGLMEHSGIYMGQGRLVELNGRGGIADVTIKEFTGHLTTFNHELWVPVLKKPEFEAVISFSNAYENALEALFNSSGRNYNLILDNCHQFTSGCITGDFENSDNFLWMLKDTVEKYEGEKIVWKKWDWKKETNLYIGPPIEPSLLESLLSLRDESQEEEVRTLNEIFFSTIGNSIWPFRK